MNPPLLRVESPILVLPTANIDTDQIVPARFLTTTDRDGLADAAFADWRSDPASPLADARARGCSVLVAGDNFGCGSSREHAAWALRAMGLRCVVSTSFADIFRGNALKNGLLPIVVPEAFHRALVAAPWSELHVDLERRVVTHAHGEIAFALGDYERDCLMTGRDDLDQLLQRRAAITVFEARREAVR